MFVGFPDPAAQQHLADGIAMVADIEPVADVEAVAMIWQRLAGQRIGDDQRKLFRKW